MAKWTRAVRVDSGNKDKLDVHAGLKRVSKSGLDPLELPKKKKQVSSDDKENFSALAAAGSQPCQKP